MGYPTAPGWPNQSGIMIPEVWSTKLLVKFYASTVLAGISNTLYEGEIKSAGDRVIIRQTPTLTVRDYVKGQTLTYEAPQPETVDLMIDKGKYWAFSTDDVDRAQANYQYVEDWTSDAAQQLKITIDTQVLADIYADAHADNKGTAAGAISSAFNLGATGSPLQLSKTNILDVIVDCGTVLDEQNVPDTDRWMVLPAWAIGMIKQSDLKDAALTGDSVSPLRNGRIGMIDRFTIYMSNLLTNTSDTGKTVANAMFGHKTALTFATQLIKNEGPMRSEQTFGDKYRGLQVYGYSVIKSQALGHLYVYK